jgi:hypothetical protein
MAHDVMARTPGRRGRWLLILISASLVAGTAAWFAVRVPFSSEVLRSRLISTLADRLDSQVELGALTLQVFPRFQARGEKLVIRHHGRRDVPPLFSVQAFTVDADLAGLLGRHVARVRLDGLEIHVPPGDEAGDQSDQREAGTPNGPHLVQGRQVVVDRLEAPGAKVVIVPKVRERPAKTWYLHELQAESVSVNTTMPFRAVLTNAVPPGYINTQGSFGPWHRDDPGHTPLEGVFTFENADLSVFKGIGGILSASGNYAGSLERIDVSGRTETPDFMVQMAGHKVPLTATYHAVVDGTNGDTKLEEIHAAFLDTSITAKGGVFDVKGVDGRLVTLDVTIDRGRLEDVMRLAVKTQHAPMRGALRMNTRLELPPGNRDVVEKLRLKGRFTIDGGQFTDAVVQERINTLSRRARGQPQGPTPQRVSSTFAGQFALSDGVLGLPSLTFDIPGAVVDLNGRYALRNETLAFRGDLVMDAKLSQTTSGFKSFLLRAVDPLFRRDGRTVVPITISGTRNDPAFGMDVKRVFSRRASD